MNSTSSGLQAAATLGRRPFSDTYASLEPSPHFREAAAKAKDDSAILEDALPASPRTPARTAPGSRTASSLARGLSLQMPQKHNNTAPNGASTPIKSPLSPKLDPTITYGSPATSIPRHSRGLDFSRASSTLHHSMLAESSPDSSPIITTQRGMAIPSRKGSVNSMVLDSPNMGPASSWPALLTSEKSVMAGSMGSVSMLQSPLNSSDSEDQDMSADEDDIMTTPQGVRGGGMQGAQTPYGGSAVTQSPAAPGNWAASFSPAAASLMKNFQKGRFGRRRSRKNSLSAGGQGGMHSPRNASPPPVRSIESANGYMGPGKFSSSRRESIALGTDRLHLSSGNDSADEDKEVSPSTPGVVRRPVTRRGNLLPKTKGFARVRAALAEESTPVDADSRREAETIKQVRERDTSIIAPNNARSPGLLPVVPSLDSTLDDIPEDTTADLSRQSSNNSDAKGLGACFSTHAAQHANTRYWDGIDKSGLRTPPPFPPSFPRNASSFSDMMLDSPTGAPTEGLFFPSASLASSADSMTDTAPIGTMHGQDAPPPLPLTKTLGKRARDEDVDAFSIKRRAVSPSLSVTNSPVVGQSPNGVVSSAQRSAQRQAQQQAQQQQGQQEWGGPPVSMGHHRRRNSGGSVSSLVSGVAGLQGETGAHEQRGAAGGGGSGGGFTFSNGPRRVGLQSMTDTHDGLMKMSIE